MKKLIILGCLGCLAVCLNAEVGNIKGEDSSCTYWFDKLRVNSTSIDMAMEDEDILSTKAHIYEGLSITREVLTKCKTDRVISLITKYRASLQKNMAQIKQGGY